MLAVLHYLLNAQDPGLEIAEIGVSQPICPLCSAVLAFLGIRYNPRWLGSSATKNWVNPWSLLDEGCKPPVGPWNPDDEDPDDKPGRGGRGGDGTSGLMVSVS